MNEAEQISLCQRNDRKAQRELYSNYYGKLMGLCLRYSKNQEEIKSALTKVDTSKLKLDKLKDAKSKLAL